MAEETQGLQGLRVLSLESRRSAEMAKLIENHGGIAVGAPALLEIPVEDNPEALSFAANLLKNQFDSVIFLTGVGTRILFGAMEQKYSRGDLVEALSRILVVARGPKPVAALREFGVPIGITVPEPNTWREILKSFEEHKQQFDLKGKNIAVQEYGVSNQEFLASLLARGAHATPVKVYRWALPDDLGPLQQAAREIAEGRIDVLLVTSATQFSHLLQAAAPAGLEDQVRTGLQRSVIASIGPISSEALESLGISPDFEPAHPKMGRLVYEAAQKAKNILQHKRR